MNGVQINGWNQLFQSDLKTSATSTVQCNNKCCAI